MSPDEFANVMSVSVIVDLSFYGVVLLLLLSYLYISLSYR